MIHDLAYTLTDPTLETVFRAQVQQNFGGTNYRNLGQQGVSWHLLALGQTLPTHRILVDSSPLSRGLARTISLSRTPTSTRSISEIKSIRLQKFWVLLFEKMPDFLFIRFLELLRYPSIVYNAIATLWQEVIRFINNKNKIFIAEAGERFLGGVHSMTQRLRIGGLYPEEREAFNVLSFGALRSQSLPRWWRDLKLVWDTIHTWLSNQENQLFPDEVQTNVYHHPLNFQVSTEWHAKPFIYTSTYGVGDAIFWADISHPQLEHLPARWLKQHVNRVELESERRLAWLRFVGRVLDLIITYIVLGPAGYVIIALRLVLAGLLTVTLNGRLTLA